MSERLLKLCASCGAAAPAMNDFSGSQEGRSRIASLFLAATFRRVIVHMKPCALNVYLPSPLFGIGLAVRFPVKKKLLEMCNSLSARAFPLLWCLKICDQRNWLSFDSRAPISLNCRGGAITISREKECESGERRRQG